MDAVVDVLDEPSFHAALAISAAGALAVLAVVHWAHVRRPVPVGGLVVAAAAAVGLVVGDALAGGGGWLLVGGVLLVGSGGVTTRARTSAALATLLLLGGATCVAIAAAEVDGRTWVRALVLAATTVGALGASRVDRAGGRYGLGPLLFAMSATGVFVCVPDTEQAIPLFAAAVGVLLALRPPASIRLGGAGAAAATGLLLWTAAVGGNGRAGSVIGAAGCLGMLVVAPAVELALGGARAARADLAAREAAGLALAHAVVVLFCARVAGFQASAATATVLVLVAWGVAAWAGATAWSRRR
jgi:hypothetical protein